MEALKMIPYIVLIICISGIIAGASALSLAKFNDTTSDADASAVIANATSAVGDIAEQLPTVAIIGIMVIIISLIAGIFVYMRYFG